MLMWLRLEGCLSYHGEIFSRGQLTLGLGPITIFCQYQYHLFVSLITNAQYREPIHSKLNKAVFTYKIILSNMVRGTINIDNL